MYGLIGTIKITFSQIVTKRENKPGKLNCCQVCFVIITPS